MAAKRIKMCAVVLLAVGTLALAACSKPVNEPTTRESGGVVASFYPAQYWTQRIVDTLVPVSCATPNGEDPASWRPGRDDMARLQKAELIVINGASFESWVSTAPLPRSRIVDSTAALTSPLISHAHAVTHSHGPGGEHSHEGIDGHTWLDPVNAAEQARAIAEALISMKPEYADTFRSNAARLDRDLQSLHAALGSIAPAMQGVTILASHPSYNYIGRRYGWRVVNLGIEPDDALTDADWNRVIALCDEAGPGPRIALWEDVPSAENADGFTSKLGAASVIFRPGESKPVEGDYLSVMQDNIAALKAALP
jgi:zinc transport system substrate-binding protein